MPSVADLVKDEAVRGLADEVAYEDGRRLDTANAVQLSRFAPLVVTSEVSAEHVEFTVVDGELAWSCTCTSGRDGAFCRHCVATALVTGRKAPTRRS